MTDNVDHSVAALRMFAVNLREHSRLPTKAVDNFRTAVRSVLDLADVADDVDVRGLDIEDTLHRHALAAGGRLSFHSIHTYANNFRHAVRMFVDWLAGDPSWDRVRTPRRPRLGPGSAEERILTSLIGHTFPVRAGVTIRLMLPADLTKPEAQRLARFVRALVL